MLPSRRPLLLSALLLALALASSAYAQRPDIEGEVRTEGILQIRIAIPDATADERSAETAAEIVATVRDDLEFSGYFDLVDPSLYRLVPAAGPGEVRHEDWVSIGAETLVELDVTVRAERLDVVARLHDNRSKTMLVGQRYGGELELTRRVAHRISSDLLKRLTGQPGVALTRIAFVSKHGDGKELYLMDYDGRRVRRLTTTGAINLSPVWSPDGNRLAFVSYRGLQPGVYFYESDGSLNQAPVVAAELNAAPDWSPDGKQLAYASDRDGNSEIYLLDLPSGTNTRLTYTAGAIETAPAISPNGREIAFTSDRTGTPQIYIMDRDGLNVRRVSTEGSYNDSATWSPRGDRLAYVSRINGRFDVVVLELASGRLTRLTRGDAGDGNNENPAWSPDGRHIVFASNRLGTYDLYTMRADGSDVRRLTRGGNCFTPHWSP